MTALLLVIAGPVSAGADEIVVHPIRFDRGASTKVVSGAVIRGQRELYSIDARARQELSLRIRSDESNAVFQVYAPGAQPEQRDYGVDIAGRQLASAPVDDKATEWKGVLRQTGRYLVVVGPDRGNATYSLTVSVR